MSVTGSNRTAGLEESQRFLPILILLFIGSGCAALIYEIVWFQLLELVIGSSAVSVGVLLGTFMGGMCVGSLMAPRLISKNHHPLKLYAMIEVGIGIIGLIILFAMPLVGGIYTSWAGQGLTSMLLRGIVAAICLLPPTFLMGATLPVISRWVKTSPEGVSWLGFFYGGNIGGAVVGSLLAGFYLMRVYDVNTTTYVAVLINLVVAALAFLISKATPFKPEAESSSDSIVAADSGAWAVYVTIGLVRFHGAGRRSHLDPASFPALWRNGLHVCADPCRISLWSWNWKQSRIRIRAQFEESASCTGLVPDAALRNHGMGRVFADEVDALLAGRRDADDRSLAQGAARYGALPLGGSARCDSLGSQFSSGSRIGRSPRTGSGPARRWRVCRQYVWSDSWVRSERASSMRLDLAASTRSRCSLRYRRFPDFSCWRFQARKSLPQNRI